MAFYQMGSIFSMKLDDEWTGCALRILWNYHNTCLKSMSKVEIIRV